MPPTPRDVDRIKDLYRRVIAIGGTGRSYAEEALLGLLAATKDPAHIPFWLETLELSRPRDTFANTRRALALSALALIAVGREDPAAYAALRAAAHHPSAQVRALAVYYLGRAYQGYDDTLQFRDISIEEIEDAFASADFLSLPGETLAAGPEPGGMVLEQEETAEEPEEADEKRPPRPVPPDVAAELAEIAAHDTAFEPRFLARRILDAAGEPVLLDNPGGSYAFKVKFMGDKRIYRTIEARSEQPLEELHLAIQRAFHWDDDHLYSFFLNGRRWDQRYQFASPWDTDGPFWTDEAAIGELGLTLKHKFLYLFDYGDEHEFEVEVIDIRSQAEPGDYPRVIDSHGKAPAQYWYDDEEGDKDDDEEWDDDEEIAHDDE